MGWLTDWRMQTAVNTNKTISLSHSLTLFVSLSLSSLLSTKTTYLHTIAHPARAFMYKASTRSAYAAALATSMTERKESGSVMAISARTFLFSVTLLLLSRFMKWLYVKLCKPYCLTPALILWIHKDRNSLFFTLRSRYAYCRALCTRMSASVYVLLLPLYPLASFMIFLWR
jgi:hypothetical protein